MKKKFEYMMRYFKSLDCGELEMRLEIDEEDIQEYHLMCKDRNINELPSNLDVIFYEICELYSRTLYNSGPGNSYNDTNSYFYVNIVIDTKNDSLIFKDIDFTEYATEDSGLEYHFDETEEGEPMYDRFIKIREFLSKENLTQITVTYNGGGDNGYIEDGYETIDGKLYSVPEFLEDISYELLEDFGGWEINEGSQGKITISANSIYIEHEWNTEEEYTNKVNIVVTKDSFDE
jgi:hypothetical protein